MISSPPARSLAVHPTLALAALALAACGQAATQTSTEATPRTAVLDASGGATAEAIFAGGCFWCTEKDFEAVPGVIEAVSGYTGGTTVDPTYEEVTRADTGHYEAVRVVYDPAQVSYAELVDYYFRTIDPTDARGQFCDKGDSYRTAIFATPEQRAIAEAELAEVRATKPFEAPVVTPVLDAQTFYDAEGYHQDYHKTNSLKYRFYRSGCGRDKRLRELWGDEALAWRPS